jgi:subtilisin family serine protease
MRTPRAEPRLVAFFVVVAVAATTAILATRDRGVPAGRTASPPSASAWRGLVGSRPQVATEQHVVVVLKTPSLADRVAAAGGAVDVEQEEAWTKVAVAAQKLLVARLALHGIVVRPEYSFARVLDGFSAVLPATAISVVERDPDVAGVYPVRIAYPATVSVTPVSTPSSDVEAALNRAGIDGRGVTVALLDTGIDPGTPSLRGRVLPGIDIVGGSRRAHAAASPDNAARVEEHGTEMAGIVAAVAPAAAVLPVRVAGWQPDGHGHWAVFARGDEILAGLERAVDPNGDGDAHDAARIALVALAEPFAAFADSPEAAAVAGARALDTLVVAPAGNDGAAGAFYGDVSSPGGAPDALTVGAIDARPATAQLRMVVHSGLASIVDATLPLAGATAPAHELDLEVAAPRGAPALTGFFTPAGGSIVAGRAALVPAGAAPGLVARRAAEAGASAVLVYGARSSLPAGALDEPVSVPVVSLPPSTAHAILTRLAAGRRVSASLGPAGDVANSEQGRVAAFSSSGLAFDGSVKPDLVAPGVGVVTPQVEGGFVTVNGSSAAAAEVAGAAALLAQARPALTAAAVAGLLVATAQPIASDPVTAQGAGALDVGAAIAGEAAASPATLALGVSTAPGRRVHASFTLTNVSTRMLHVTLGIRTQDEGAAALRFALRPARLTIDPGRSRVVGVDATTTSRAIGNQTADGAVVASIEGGGSVRVPWAMAFGSDDVQLVRAASLSSSEFSASDRRPALLTVDVGVVDGAAGRIDVRPLTRLDLLLARAEGPALGLLARLRDVLPGRYTFGLTGRGPSGEPLAPGRYVVTLVGYPVDGGRPSRRKLGFTLR